MAQPFLTSTFQDPGGEEVESWDDGDIQGIDNLHLRNFSTTTVASNVSSRTPNQRDSLSSRLSVKSEPDEDGDLQFHIPAGDAPTSNIIADAKSRGVPLPENIPVSALLGGTIKRLGGRRIQKAIGDDWGDDLELPNIEGLKLKLPSDTTFPDSLRQLGTVVTASKLSPERANSNPSISSRPQPSGQLPAATLAMDQYRDSSGDYEFSEDTPTIRISKNRASGRSPLFDTLPSGSTPPQTSSAFEDGGTFMNQSPQKQAPQKRIEPFDEDFELPDHGDLKLSTRKDIPKTPASQSIEDGEFDWADGSGSFSNSQTSAKRSERSNRSSSVSARSPSVFSPSLSSCMTAESEDEGLDGLVLPDGPLHFEEALQKRLENASPDTIESKRANPLVAPNDDFFQGLEIGDGEVFDSAKATLNRNVKHKQTRQGSSPKRPAMTLTFTNKVAHPITRIPKPSGQDRARTKLEPVLENVGQSHPRPRAKSRLDGHPNQLPISSIPTPTSIQPVPSLPPTPSRRGLTSKPSKENLRTDNRLEPTTTTAQLLRSKRSMPILGRNPASPTRAQAPSFPRPSSRTGQSSRTGPGLRPKTPVDRMDSSAAHVRKPPVPFLPAGSATRPLASKSSRVLHRPTSSENSNDSVAASTRSMSRQSNHPYRQHSPSRRDLAPDALAKAAATKRQVTKPVRRRAYGDGNELDGFDDLPTSTTTEARFRKMPSIGKLPSSPALRKAYSHNVLSSSRPTSTIPPPTPTRTEGKPLPRFAQSTTASLARKQRTGAVSPEMLRRPSQFNEASQTLNVTYRLQPPPKPHQSRSSTTKRLTKSQQKPHLIKQLGNSANESKSIKGMHYNPVLYRWEGNEQALAPFDVPNLSPPPAQSMRPGLIAPIGFSKGVQVEGGMVFDPQSMRWLKITSSHQRGRAQSSTAASLATDDDEDPFAGIEDLAEETKPRIGAGGATGRTSTGMAANSAATADGKHGLPVADPGSDNDDWVVGEEFDVGPEFVKRQRNEEAKWRRRMQGWAPCLTKPPWEVGERWALRDLVMEGSGIGQRGPV